MEKGKFNITVRMYDDNDNFVETKQMEVEGWTYKGLGYYKNNDTSTNSKYNVTHLGTGSALYYAGSKHDAETFMKTLTKDIDCTMETEKFTKEIFEYIKQPNNVFEVMGGI